MTMLPPHPDFKYDEVFEVEDHIFFYSESLTNNRSDVEVDGLVQIAKLEKPVRILDVPCGFGRHTNRLTALGHSLVGIDFYRDFLDLARKDAEARGLLVDYCQADMRNLCFKQSFDRVLMLFTSFGYFEDCDNYKILEEVARSLIPNGLFVLDIPNRDTTVKSMIPTHVIEKNGDLMIDRLFFDTITGRLYNRRIMIRNGIRKDKPFFVRLFHPYEITRWLEQAGMKVIEFYSGYDGQKQMNESKRMILVAVKSE